MDDVMKEQRFQSLCDVKDFKCGTMLDARLETVGLKLHETDGAGIMTVPYTDMAFLGHCEMPAKEVKELIPRAPVDGDKSDLIGLFSVRYRAGGREFWVILSDADIPQAQFFAEELVEHTDLRLSDSCEELKSELQNGILI